MTIMKEKKPTLKRQEVVEMVLNKLQEQGIEDITIFATYKRLNLKGLLHFLEVTKNGTK